MSDRFNSPSQKIADRETSGLTRRSFLRSVCTAVGVTSLTSTVFDLRRIAAAAPLAGDYKALVCVFLYGGNDSNNVLVPRGTDYAAYAAARGPLALSQATLLPVTPLSGGDGRQWGLHPGLPGLRNLFNQQRLALVANVGPLVAPVTRAELLAGTAALPPQLFSHSDQTVHWQTSLPDQPARSGWGGRVADLLHSLNGTAQVSMSMSLAGNNTFQVGNAVTQYQLSSEGSIGLGWYSDGTQWNDPPSTAIRSLMARSYGNRTSSSALSIRTACSPPPWIPSHPPPHPSRASRTPTWAGSSAWSRGSSRCARLSGCAGRSSSAPPKATTPTTARSAGRPRWERTPTS